MGSRGNLEVDPGFRPSTMGPKFRGLLYVLYCWCALYRTVAPPSRPDQPHQLGPGARARCRRGPVPGAGRMLRVPPGAVRLP